MLKARFCGPLEMLDGTGLVVYMLAFSASMHVYNVFHVSLLKKCVHDPNYANDWNMIHMKL
jgi:hypothetical protein